MAINYNEYVPIDALIQGFYKLVNANSGYADKAMSLNKEIKNSYKELSDELKKVATEAAKIDGKNLANLAKIMDRNVEAARRQKEMMDALSSSVDVNDRSINQLKTLISALEKEYKKLDPTAKGFAASQKDLADRTNLAITAMRAQEKVLQEATKTAGAAANSYRGLVNHTAVLKARLEEMPGAFNTTTREIDKTNAAAVALQRQIHENERAIAGMAKAMRPAREEVVHLAGSYNDLNQRTNRLKAELKAMQDAFNPLTGDINKHNAAAKQMQQEIDKNVAALKRMDAQMGNHQRNVGNYASGVSNGFATISRHALGAAAAITGISTAFQAISSAVKTIDMMDRLNITLENASGSTAKFLENQKMVIGLVNQTGSSLESTTRQYIKFTAATQGTRLEGQAANEIFASFTRTFAALGASNVTAERGLLAIEQMISKNTVGAEELRQQLGDALPGSVRLFTEAYKELHNMSELTTGQFMDLMKQGKVVAEDILPIIAARLEDLYGAKAQRNLQTITGSWTNMVNQIQLLLNHMNDDGVVSRFFARINNGLATFFKNMKYASTDDFFKNASETRAAMAGREFADPMVDNNRRSEMVKNATVELQRLQDRADDIRQIFREGSAGGWFKSWSLRRELSQTEEYIERQTQLVRDYAKSWAELEDAAAKAEFQRRVDAGEIDETGKVIKVDKPTVKAGGKEAGGKSTEKVLSEYEQLNKQMNELRNTLTDEAVRMATRGEAFNVDDEVLEKWNKLYAIMLAVSQATGENIPSNIRELNQKLNPDLPNLLDDPTNTEYGRVQKLDVPSKSTAPKQESGPDITNALNTYMQNMANLDTLFDEGRLRLAGEKYKNRAAEIYKEIYDLQSKGDSERNKEKERALRDELRLVQENARAQIAARKQITQESIKLAGELVNTIFEINKNFRQAEMESLQVQMDHDLELVGDSEEKKKAVKKSYDRQMKQLRMEQAKADKAQAIFSVGMNTAMAVTNALATSGPIWLGIAMAAIAGAMGALQLATIMSKPLPQFYKGTKYAPEGLAYVAERGPELRESKGRMIYYDKPQIANLERGDKIYTAQETSRMLAEGLLAQDTRNDALQRSITGNRTINEVNSVSPVVMVNNNIDYDRMAAAMSKSMSERPIYETIIDERGQRKRIRRKNAYIEYLNKIMP